MCYIDEVEAQLREKLTEVRYNHSILVRDEAMKLAEQYGYSIEKAGLAGLLHDYARCLTEEEMNAYVLEYKMAEKYLDNNALAHSKIGAELVKVEVGVLDHEILDAIKYHTTGRRGMTTLDKIIYLADMIEPGRNFPYIEELRELAYINLNEACYFALNNSILHIINKDDIIDIDTIYARNTFFNLVQIGRI